MKKIGKNVAPAQYPTVCSYNIYLNIAIERDAPVNEGHLSNFYVFFIFISEDECLYITSKY